MNKENITVVMSEALDPEDCRPYITKMISWLSRSYEEENEKFRIKTICFPFCNKGQKFECLGKSTDEGKGVIFVGTEKETNEFDNHEFKKYL